MIKKDMIAIAMANIEKHIGDLADGEEELSILNEEAYVLGVDGLLNRGVDLMEAGKIARLVADSMYPIEEESA